MEEEDDDQEQEETKPQKVEEKKKFDPPAPRQKTKTGDYIVTKINVKERVVEHHHEGKVNNSVGDSVCVVKENWIERIDR